MHENTTKLDAHKEVSVCKFLSAPATSSSQETCIIQQSHADVAVTRGIVVLQGKAAIVAQSRLLEGLAERCGQAGAMHWLQHFLNVPTFRGKQPWLLMGLTSGTTIPDALNLQWAVLLYELVPAGLGTGIFSTDDISGFRTVIAPVCEREAVIASAADTLLKLGAQIVMISSAHRSAASMPTAIQSSVPARWAVRERPVANTLPAQASYEATLRSLGKGTRFNMRYYRRRLLRQMDFVLVPDARGMFSEDEIVAMNAASLNPFSPGLAVIQYASCNELSGGFLMGLRAADGRWLSLVGGWRQADTTVLLWQMNRAGLERSSLGTVMRSYFVQHEVEHGAARIVFYGGTPNTIEHSFTPDHVTDVIVVRKGWKGRILSAIAALLGRPRWLMKNPNFIARSICDPSLVWHQTMSSGATDKIELA